MQKVFLKIRILLIIVSLFLILSTVSFANETNILETTDGINVFSSEINNNSDNVYMIDSKNNEITEVNMEDIVTDILKRRTTRKIPSYTEGYTPKGYLNDIDEFKMARTSSLIRIANTNTNPYQKICKLSWEDNSSGSGFMVGPNIVLTSAHCFLDNNGNVFSNWSCAPSYDYGVKNGLTSGWQKAYFGGWTSTHNSGDDWCLVVLDWNMGNQVGWLGCQSYSTNSEMLNITVHAIGYPKDENCQYQYYAPGTINTVTSTYFSMTATPRGGMSGGPTINWSSDMAIGINHGYYTEQPQNGISCKIHQNIINLIINNT